MLRHKILLKAIAIAICLSLTSLPTNSYSLLNTSTKLNSTSYPLYGRFPKGLVLCGAVSFRTHRANRPYHQKTMIETPPTRPQPSPDPSPDPNPQPVPTPEPQPVPAPIPQPVPTPIPQPVPTPEPQPIPQPK